VSGPSYNGERYFAPKYFGRYFQPVAPVGDDYFGDKFFGNRYFGEPFYGPGAVVPPPTPTTVVQTIGGQARILARRNEYIPGVGGGGGGGADVRYAEAVLEAVEEPAVGTATAPARRRRPGRRWHPGRPRPARTAQPTKRGSTLGSLEPVAKTVAEVPAKTAQALTDMARSWIGTADAAETKRLRARLALLAEREQELSGKLEEAVTALDGMEAWVSSLQEQVGVGALDALQAEARAAELREQVHGLGRQLMGMQAAQASQAMRLPPDPSPFVVLAAVGLGVAGGVLVGGAIAGKKAKRKKRLTIQAIGGVLGAIAGLAATIRS